MATQIRVLIAIMTVTLVVADQNPYANRIRRRPMLSSQEGPDLIGAESEQESALYQQGMPSDFNPSPQIPDEPRSDNDQQVEIGGLTVQDPPKGWPFSDMALQEKFQEQIQQEGTAQRQMWSSPSEQLSKQQIQQEENAQRQMWSSSSEQASKQQMQQEETAQRQMWSNPPEQTSKQHRYRQGRLLDGNPKGRKEQSSREEGSGEQTYREYSKKKRVVKPSNSQGSRIRQSNKQYHQETTQLEEQQPQQYHPEQYEQQKLQQEQQTFAAPEPIMQEDLTPRPPKKHTKRRPTSSANTGGPTSVSVGYSLNFGNQESGKSGRNPVGIVQSEVVHGDGAVSYSNTQLGAGSQGHRSRPSNADTIDGRPIYVPPIPSNYNRAPQQNYQNRPEHESLPNPSALIGEEDINGYAPEGASVVKSTSHFEIGQSPETQQIITQLDHSSQYESKPIKPPTILHINDGSDFKWKNLGNGVEISAPVTPNGLKGGYRESIPIQEDNEEDIPIFDKKPPVFIPPIPPKPIVFNSGIQFEQDPNAIFSGPPGEIIEGNFPKGELLPTPQELTSNHIFEEAPPKIPNSIQSPPPQFSRRPNIYNHNFAEPPPKFNEETSDNLGFPKFPEMNKIYYLPNIKPGEAPIPAVVMPLSLLRQITGSLDSQSTAHLGQDISTSEFMKMLSNNDVVSEPAPQFHEHRPQKQRTHGFNPNKGHQNLEGRPTRTHHRYQQNYNNANNKFNVGPYGVKVTKSIPIYEQHTVSSQNDVPHGPWNGPPKQHTQVQHYNIPLEAYESLRPNPGNFKGRPNHYREERPQYRHARQNHQQNRDAVPTDPHGNPHAVDGESFAVSSSYRIGPQAPSGWNKHGRN